MIKKYEGERRKDDSEVFSLHDQLKLSMIENTIRECLGMIYDPCSCKHVKFEILVGEDTQKKNLGSEAQRRGLDGFENQNTYKKRAYGSRKGESIKYNCREILRTFICRGSKYKAFLIYLINFMV